MKDAIRHLDQRFAGLRPLVDNPRPPKGWIRAIRNALGMTTAQMARRMNVSQPRIVELEQSEVSGSVTLGTLQRAAEALGCRVVYALVPERPLDEILAERAEAIAKERVASVEHTMRLEDQAVRDSQSLKDQTHEVAEELLRRPARLWDGV